MDGNGQERTAMTVHVDESVDIRTTGKTGRRRAVIVTACVLAALLAGGGVAAVLTAGAADRKPAAPKKLNAATAPIERGTLQGTSSTTGTLAYSGSRTIGSGSGGVITALPVAGASIGLGQSLFAVDNQPTYMMLGTIPAWRAFESGMDDGPDVKALEESLTALGYFDRAPDEEFTWATRAAITRWQKTTGQEQTGSIPLGRIVFAPGELRVAELGAAVGDQIAPGARMLTATDLTKSVSVDLKLADQQLGVLGASVAIDLPDGKRTTGTVASVGVPTEKDAPSGGKAVVIPVVIALDDPAATGALQQASVMVRFPTEKRENVLSVPVGALLALNGDRFGVEVVRPDGSTERVPVTTGLFAAGRVEIAGKGLKEGRNVVVPSL